MKPIVNYGLSDSLIDAVRKSVEEGKGDGNLANNAKPYNKITRGDVIAGRLGNDEKGGKKGGKTTINTNPKLKEEEVEQMDEISSELAGRASNARIDRNMSGGTSHTDIRKLKKGSMTPLDQQRKTTAGYMKTLDRKNEEYEQMDESLDSIAKKHGMKYTTTAYGAGMKHPTKGEISINRYGEWHHKGTNKTGDSENDFSSLDKHLSTVKEEEQMDEAPLRAVNALVGYPKLNKKVAAKGTPGSEDERNKAAAGLKRDRSGLGRRAYTGDQHYDVRREEVEQMDEANSDNPEYEKALIKIDMHHYKEADQHRRTLQTLGTQGKLNTPEGKFHKAALEKHQATLNAMAASDHERIRKKLKQSMRSNLKREDVEQMDEVKLADLPRRKVVGKSYGADYVDPEGADETAADMKKAEPKRKSGPQGTMKRRFIKDKSKLRMQYK